MEKFSFTKMSGAGNDFIVLKDFPGSELSPVLIKNLCDRRNGIGADGVITISASDEADFRMQYYNSDGYTGSLCGNGARCAIKFAHSEGLAKDRKVKFISGNTGYTGEILEGERIKFNLNPPEKIKRNFSIELSNKKLKLSFADTGSPHAVIKTGEIADYFGTKYSLNEIPVEGLGREIRHNNAFAPGGANVNFVSCEKERVFIRTFERGVEAETLACGTGSVAAAVILFLDNIVKPPVLLVTKSGEELEVNFTYRDNRFSDVSLTGPAKIIFTGEYRT
jgi:diaminopimelate epimerase